MLCVCCSMKQCCLQCRMYQREVDVDMLNALKSLLVSQSTYPHQPCVDTFCAVLLCRRRLKLVLTGTSIPLSTVVVLCTVCSFSIKYCSFPSLLLHHLLLLHVILLLKYLVCSYLYISCFLLPS